MLIWSKFMFWIHAITIPWNTLNIIFNRTHNVTESMKLCEIFLRNLF